jgi:hypothetical protein
MVKKIRLVCGVAQATYLVYVIVCEVVFGSYLGKKEKQRYYDVNVLDYRISIHFYL